MNSSLKENLITTKDAGELSGYTSDYLSRLVRSGHITGERIGHNWIIERASLERFMEKQKTRKTDRARELANARAEEYRKHHQLLRRVTKSLTSGVSVPQMGLAPATWGAQLAALSTALVVVVSGAALARTDTLPRFAGSVASVAQEASSGFAETFGTVPSHIASRVGIADAFVSASVARVAAARDAYQTSLPLAQINAASLSPLLVKNYHASNIAVGTAPALIASVPPVTAADLYATALEVYAFITTPSQIAGALGQTYQSLASGVYAGAATSLSAYGSFIAGLQTTEIAIGNAVFESLAKVPGAVANADIALGNVIIGGAHAAIHADVFAAYGIAAAAPASARATVAFLGTTGSVLAGATARVPALATAAYLRVTAAPATLAPALAQAVFGAEYTAASHFVRATDAISSRYLALLEGAGRLTYQGTEGSLAIARAVARAPAAIEDAYLGTLGKSALALNSITPAASLAAVATAVQPALSVGEQAALSVYQTMHSFFGTVGSSLTSLFNPTSSTTSVPIKVPAPATAEATTTAPAFATSATSSQSALAVHQTVNTYPTYTTVVQGISQSTLDQALASLRSGILSTTAGMIQPVAAQGATNATTIQYVNMIQDLSDLTVRNGTFKGGTFNGGAVTDATAISSANGTFTNLTGGAATFTSITGGASTLATTTVAGTLAITGNASITGSLTIGTTTITGPLAVSGTATLGPIVTAGSFVATSTMATSTFAGSFAIDTNGFVYATSTKNVGIGTTSPLSRLAVSGGATVGADFNVAAPANSLLVESSVGIGTTTTDAVLSLLQRNNGNPIISAYRSTDTAPAGDFINYKSAAGNTLFRVDNSGNITGGGIVNTGSVTITSTSTPQFRVQYDPTSEWTMTTNATGSTTLAVNGTAPALAFTPQSDATSTFRFTNAASNSILSIDTLHQLVGIGTTSPAATLGVQGSIGVNPSQLYLAGNGNVGVGTNNPSSLFQVYLNSPDTSSVLPGLVYSRATTGVAQNGIGTQILFQAQNSAGAIKNASAIDSQLSYAQSGSEQGTLYFQTANAGNLNEAMRITYAGNVGIGTTSPSQVLSVEGNGLFSGNLTAANITATGTLAASSLTLTNALTVANGGTGVATLTGLVKGNGTAAFSAAVPSVDYVPPSTTINGHALSSNVSVALSELSDATVTSPVTDQVLRWDGTKWVNGSAVAVSAGSGVNYFYTTALSDVSPYDVIQKTPDTAAEVNESITVNNNTATIDDYASPAAGIGATQIDAGVWNFNTYATSSAATGSNVITFNVYKRTSGGTETYLFSATTTSINDTTPLLYETRTVQPAFAINATDRLVVKVTGTTSNVTNTTISLIHSGSTHYSFINTPLVLRHNDLAGIQGGAAGQYYHLTAAEYAGTGTGTFAKQDSPTFTTQVVVSGNLGVGTTSPLARLDVAGANNGTAPLLQLSSVASYATTTQFIVTNAGNVGIGTTTPYAQLSVQGMAAAGTAPLFTVASSTGTSILTVAPTATEGQVLINAASDFADTYGPHALYIQSPDGKNLLALGNDTGTTRGAFYINHGSYNEFQFGTITNSPFGFYTNNNTPQLSLNPNGGTSIGAYGNTPPPANGLIVSGNVGIGTTTPGSLLSLAGIANFTTATSTFYSSGGINLTAGCFSVNGVCAGTGSGGVGSGVQGQVPFYNAAGTNLIATSSISIAQSGNVGIGTTSPFTTLAVTGTQRIKTTTNTDNAFTIENSNATSTLDVSTLDSSSNIFSVASSTGQSFFEITAAGNVGLGTTSPETTLTVVGSICAARSAGIQTTACGSAQGAIYANSSSLTGGYDVAEMYPTSDATLGAGDVISFDTVNAGKIARAAAPTAPFLGIVSTSPGLTLGSSAGGALPLTLAGRVPTKVSAANGPIAAGDRLILSSTTPGVAVKALHSGETIGVALAPYGASGTGSINVFVSPQYWLAPGDISIDPMSGMIGIGTTTPNHTLTVAGDVGAIAFVNTSTRDAKDDISYIASTTAENMFNQLVNLKVATYRYKIENQNDPLRLGFIAEDAQTVAPEVLSPDGKGVDLYKLATFTLSGVQTLAAKVSAQDVRLTSLEARVAALENGSVSVASGSPITLGTSTLASALNGFGVLIQKGIAQFNTLVFRQLVASTDTNGTSSAGSVVVLAGNTVAQVNNALVLPTTKVFVTFNSQITGSWWVSDKTAGSFRVVLSAPQTSDVSFDYFLVQTQGQIATSTPDGSFPSVAQSSGPDTVPPVITLLGGNPLYLTVGSVFTEPGVTVADTVDGTDPYITFINGMQQAVSSTTIDTSSPTTYLITYKSTDQAGNTATVMRSVIVGNPDGTVSTSGTATTTSSTDTTPPVVTLNGAAAMQLTIGNAFTDPGATATDNVDGTLTSKIVETGSVSTTTVGSYTLTYSATDAAGNTGSASRLVSVVASSTATTATTTPVAAADTTPPVVTLNGTATMSLTQGGTFTDPGATALDNIDGNLTAKIVETGAVDAATTGSYTLTYSATDTAGNTGSATRTVTVVASSTSATTTPTI